MKYSYYSKPSLILVNWRRGERSSVLTKQMIALKLRKQINGECNNVSSADEKK
jgi:hypothetical protein